MKTIMLCWIKLMDKSYQTSCQNKVPQYEGKGPRYDGMYTVHNMLTRLCLYFSANLKLKEFSQLSLIM